MTITRIGISIVVEADVDDAAHAETFEREQVKAAKALVAKLASPVVGVRLRDAVFVGDQLHEIDLLAQ